MFWIAAAVLVFLEVVLPLLLWGMRDGFLFHPDTSLPAEAGLPWIGKGIVAEAVVVTRPDGRRLEAIDARPEGPRDGGPVVLFLHGNSGNVAGRTAVLGAFVRGTGARTLMLGYSGFGGNEGRPTADEVVADGLAAYDHLRAAGVPATRIVVFGESIGGGVAAAVAEKRECAGVVFQSTFASLSAMALDSWPWIPLTAVLARGTLDSVDSVGRIRCPMLVVHGDRDEMISYMQGKALHRAAAPRADFLPVPGAGHNDLFEVAGEDYLRGLGERFRKWTGTPGPR